MQEGKYPTETLEHQLEAAVLLLYQHLVVIVEQCRQISSKHGVWALVLLVLLEDLCSNQALILRALDEMMMGRQLTRSTCEQEATSSRVDVL